NMHSTKRAGSCPVAAHLIALLGLGSAACGVGDPGATDPEPTSTATGALSSGTSLMAKTDGPDSAAPLSPTAPHLDYNGGRVVSHVNVVAVMWGSNVNSTVATRIPTFYDTITRGSYMDWLSEYNTPSQVIGRGSLGGAFTITPNNGNANI